jgi:hypothetical protein
MSAPVDVFFRRPEGCLSDLALDRLRAGELAGSADAVRTHLQGCAACTARLAEIESDAANFSETPSGPLRARRWPLVAAGTAALAAAASIFLVVSPSDTTRAKGSDELSLMVRHPDGRVENVLPGQALFPDDALSFELVTERRGQLVILDLDSRGAVTPFEPKVKGLYAGRWGQHLEGSFVLDDALGPERFDAVICDPPVATVQLVAAVKAALAKAGGDPAKVEPFPVGLPCHEASVLIEKKAHP